MRTWQAVLDSGSISAGERVLLALPLSWGVGADAYLALLDRAALTCALESASLDDVLSLRSSVLVCTLGDALRLANTAASRHLDLAQADVRLVVVTAEPGGSLDVTRRLVEDRWGATCLDVYALSECGVIGWGCERRTDGIHLDEGEGSLALAVMQSDGDGPVAPGDLGELVITTPLDWDTPLDRFRTGDLVRLKSNACDCGRGPTWAQGGVLGRADERLEVRGHVILPSLVEQVVRRHPAVIDFGLRAYTVRGECELAVHLEVTDAIGSEGDRARVAAEVTEDLRRSLGLRLQCDVLPPSPAEGKTTGRRTRRLRRH